MKTNLSFFIFLLIALLACINDMIIYLFSINYDVSLIISFFIIILIIIIMNKKNKIHIINNFKKRDLFVIIPYLLYSFILMMNADEKLDTYNYHIYIQKNFFNDKINFDYLPNCSFFFPLGDRMAFIFRKLLGYRFGTILSVFAVIVMYFQIKKILLEIFSNLKNKNWHLLICSSLALFLITPNWRIATYHIDNFSMVVLLELYYFIIKKKELDIYKYDLLYSFLLLGIATAIKISNFFIGITLIMYSFLKMLYKANSLKNMKISIKDSLLYSLIFIFPFIVYLINNYIQTKNPIFPFGNFIFKSIYYNNVTGMDNKFGIPNILCAFIWPIVVTIDPLKGFDYSVIEPIWGIGYIACIIVFILKFNKKDKIWEMSLINIILTIVWAVLLNGYVRYAQILPIAYYILIISNYANIMDKSIKIINDIQSVIIIISIFISLIVTLSIDLAFITERVLESWNNKIAVKDFFIKKDYYEIDGVWGSIAFNSGMIDLIRNPKTPIYNLDIVRGIDNTKSSYSEFAQNYVFDALKEKRVFTITSNKLFKETINYLEEEHFEIVSEIIPYYDSRFQDKDDKWFIIEIKVDTNNSIKKN